MIMAIVIIAFSCTKSNDTTKSNAVKYCGTISWSNSKNNQSGIFTGDAASGSYRLTDVQYTENTNSGHYPLHYDSNGHLINDQSGVTYTYTQNYLSKINVDLQNGNGNGSYNFDSNGHLTTGIMNFTSSGYTGTMTGTYTYDSNDDPVGFSATGTVSTQQGPVTLNIQGVGDFLLDKTSFLPFDPLFAPPSSYFSFIPFVSKHLLNKWVITISSNVLSPTVQTAQYAYTYDANGNIATMTRSDNPNSTYVFTYSNCN